MMDGDDCMNDLYLDWASVHIRSDCMDDILLRLDGAFDIHCLYVEICNAFTIL